MIDQASLALVRLALAEDLAGYGDVTSAWTVPVGLRGRAEITAREDLVVCGLTLAAAVMHEVDPLAVFIPLAEDGSSVADRDRLAMIEGPVRSILAAERSMLNFLSHLSGVATHSRRFALAVDGTGARVVDTRKTTPGCASGRSGRSCTEDVTTTGSDCSTWCSSRTTTSPRPGASVEPWTECERRGLSTSRSRWRWKARPIFAKPFPAVPTSSCWTTRGSSLCGGW